MDERLSLLEVEMRKSSAQKERREELQRKESAREYAPGLEGQMNKS